MSSSQEIGVTDIIYLDEEMEDSSGNSYKPEVINISYRDKVNSNQTGYYSLTLKFNRYCEYYSATYVNMKITGYATASNDQTNAAGAKNAGSATDYSIERSHPGGNWVSEWGHYEISVVYSFSGQNQAGYSLHSANQSVEWNGFF